MKKKINKKQSRFDEIKSYNQIIKNLTTTANYDIEFEKFRKNKK